MFEIYNKLTAMLEEINDQRERFGKVDPDLLSRYDALEEELVALDDEMCDTIEEDLFHTGSGFGC